MSAPLSPAIGRPVRILSLDDGGIRGLSSLLILEHIAEHIRDTAGLSKTKRPCEMFDLIGGTGTGGIIAIMLGRLKMTLGQSIKAYKSLAETVLSPDPANLSTQSPEARLALVETAIKRIIRENCSDAQCVEQQLRGSSTADTCPHEDTLFQDRNCAKTAVLAMTKVNVETLPTLFSTYNKPTSFAECKIWEIAMAISAPNNFVLTRIGRDEEEFIDAKYGYNNPCEVLIAEAEKEFPGREMMILSIGTGLGDVVEISDSKSSVFRAYSKVTTTSKQVDLRLREKHSSTGGYYRFNVENGLQDVAPLDSHKPSYIAGHTRNYLGENKHLVEHFGRAFVSGTLLPLLQPSELKVYLDENDKKCLLDLFVTDPSIDKKDIETKKGGLLKDSYKWIIEHADFKRFKTDSESRVLWIKGDPGKGKTMLLCGIINELESDPPLSLSYFFCQATGGERLNTASSVLRGLIYNLGRRNPQLVKHVREKYDHKGNQMFNNGDTWRELCEIMSAMLNDPTLEHTVLIVDALDECSVERQRLLRFISTASPAKWIVSSRNQLDIEEIFNDVEEKVTINLEMNQNLVSAAVDIYIMFKADQLARREKYDATTKSAVLGRLQSNANCTFLWVSLVCKVLSHPETRNQHALEVVNSFPPGLDSLYGQMLEQINQSSSAKLAKAILATVLTVYRPVTLDELHGLVEEPKGLKETDVEAAIDLRGSFLVVYENVVSFVHQSAKDYLLNEGSSQILPRGISHQHHRIFVQSLELLRFTLKRDIYRLHVPGRFISEVATPEPDPLAPIHYYCIFWADHLHESSENFRVSEQERILAFFEERYLEWLEALSLLRKMSVGVSALQKLEVYLQGKASRKLQNILKEDHRFLHSHRGIFEVAPLQIYTSALLFNPTKSLIRQQFDQEKSDFIEAKKIVETGWSACCWTLKSHGGVVTTVVYSNDGLRLASGSQDKTVKIWDATSGTCLMTLNGHDDRVRSIVFSNDGQRLASGSWDNTVKIWDATSGACLHTLGGHDDRVTSVTFSNDGQQLASGSEDWTLKIWDATSGTCIHTLEGHDDWVTSVVFSHDGKRLASGSSDKTVRVWDATFGTCLHTLEGHDDHITSVVFLDNGQRLASGSWDRALKIWDAISGTCLHTLGGHDDLVTSVGFSKDGQRLASGSEDTTVKIWDATSGTCLHTLEGHKDRVTLVVFSSDGQRLASGSEDKTVKIWDATSGTCLHNFEDHGDQITSAVFSSNGQRLATGSEDKTVKIWDTTFRTCLHTLEGHNDWVTSTVVLSNDGQRLKLEPHDKTAEISDATFSTCPHTLESHQVVTSVFSNDGERLAGSEDKTVKIWDVTSGTLLHTLEGHDNWVTSVVFSNDGQRLASGSEDTTLKIWDATSGTCLHTLGGHDDRVTSVMFSNDGQRLASLSEDKTVRVWHAFSGTCLHTFGGHDDQITSVVLSDDGRRLGSGSEDRILKIWDATSGTCLHTLEGHDDRIISVVFSDDGQRLASGSWDKTLKIWDATSGACLHTLRGHDDRVTSVMFSNDGQRLGSGSWDKVWQVASSACLQTLSLGRQTPFSFNPFGYFCYPSSIRDLDLDMFIMSSEISPTSQASPPNSNVPRYRISADGAWIMEDEERVVWLPPGYRLVGLRQSNDLLVRGTRVALCSPSNHIFILEFTSFHYRGKCYA